MAPFTIRIKDRVVEQSELQPLRLKLDPGSKVTGIGILREVSPEKSVAVLLAELHHKPGIKAKLDSRRALRRGRRNRKTRYRPARFNNRAKSKGWLPPSLEARVAQTINAVTKLRKIIPLATISTEHVKFDTQLLQNPGMAGVEYQQGELMGYEIREYLLEKWRRKCAYCGKADIPLEVEHIIPKSRGGTNRISNLTLACCSCNQTKGNKTAEEFGYPEIQKQAQMPLKDAAMMNATRWRLFGRLKETTLPVECGTGARTKKQRIEHNLPKAHYYDACCVGASTPASLVVLQKYISIWKATGRGIRRLCTTDKYGFPKSHRQRKKKHFAFQTGDVARVEVPRGKYRGSHTGRVVVRARGAFDLKSISGGFLCQGISHKHYRLLQRADGWQHEKVKIA